MTNYYVEMAPGCHGKPFAPVVSYHRTWESAKRKALRCDRWVAVNGETGETFAIPQQDDPRLGRGRYGNGMTVQQARNAGLL